MRAALKSLRAAVAIRPKLREGAGGAWRAVLERMQSVTFVIHYDKSSKPPSKEGGKKADEADSKPWKVYIIAMVKFGDADSGRAIPFIVDIANTTLAYDVVLTQTLL